MSFILGLLGACLGIILAVAIIIGIILMIVFYLKLKYIDSKLLEV